MTAMNSPTIHHLRAERQARRTASASSAACHWLAHSEPAVAAQYPVATPVSSSNAHRWKVLPASKLAHLAAWFHHANVHLGEHELPATTYNFNETSVAIGGRIRVGDFDRWLTHQNRNLQAQPGRRGQEEPGPVRNL